MLRIVECLSTAWRCGLSDGGQASDKPCQQNAVNWAVTSRQRIRMWWFVNAVEIEEAISKLATEPFDASEFHFALLKAFGNKATMLLFCSQSASVGHRNFIRGRP